MKKVIATLLLTIPLIFINPRKIWAATFTCGDQFPLPTFKVTDCDCEHNEQMYVVHNPTVYHFCCGWYYDGTCNATEPPLAPSPTPRIEIPEVNSELLDNFNPLKNFSTKANQLSTPGGIISEILTYSFPIAGVILFAMLIVAGFKMLTGASNSSGMEEAKKMISTAIIGFIILFAAYWIAQLLEIIFGITILG